MVRNHRDSVTIQAVGVIAFEPTYLPCMCVPLLYRLSNTILESMFSRVQEL
jgi:hypothetical protein